MPTRSAPLLLPSMQELMRLYAQDQTAIAQRNAFFFTLQFLSWARSASCIPKTVAAFNPKHHLCMEDIRDEIIAGRRYTVVGLKVQKQDAEGNLLDCTGHDWVPMAVSPGRLMDIGNAWDEYRALLEAAGALMHSPLVQQANNRGLLPGCMPATYGMLLTAFKAGAHRLQLTGTAQWGLHSLRRGGATAAVRAGMTPQQIRTHGRWASDCWTVYAILSRQQVLQVAQAVADFYV